ncbi:cysteine desulfurase-like protein [Sandarakinorhabdus cyanobacteriorum]|uniref:Cysteine desulfurase-like protein n=1 Tax=Sandarakinorhabdus cyanobacteriorum TaxID=1981098 RepID=A0A255Y6Y1_9SPHN|nr:cysteine desulfurase-like protein [Sandarakinorhabdus cyanobacteriorum]OYQ24982.1 cysteine desulfurase-like protein [Sandarakinorhabdus cyanobacteriorum]
MILPIDTVRAAFPALALCDDGVPRHYFDAPAGSQVAGRVISAMTDVMIGVCANDGGLFRTSVATSAIFDAALATAASFFNCGDDEVIFGLNTTSLFFQMAPLIAHDWRAGDNILVTRMDHDANVSPWLQAAAARGVEVRFLAWDRETFALKLETLPDLIDARTRAVAVGHASNMLGTINDVAAVCAAARAVGATSIVDAVQSAPHLALDVAAIGCDLMSASAYKFFGPHAAIMCVSKALQVRIPPLKVRPSVDAMPTRLSPGTPSFEAMAGTAAAIDHLAWLGEVAGTVTADQPLRTRLEAGFAAAQAHELELARQFLAGLGSIKGVTLHGIANPNRLHERVATFTFEIAGHSADAIAADLAARNMFVWNGYYYAWEPAGVLGLKERGAVRVGFTHYNSAAEVEALIAALSAIAAA